MAPAIVLLGPPGSGKGTQARRLEDFTVLATGDLLRRARGAETDLGRKAARYMDRGELVPDDVIVGVVRESLRDLHDDPILFDGFPRTVAQAEALADVLHEHDRELTAAVMVDVPDDIVVERILGRHEGRADDNPDTVGERLRVYHSETEPLVDYYEQRGLLRRVEGTRGPDDVAGDVRAAIDGGG